ncbi:MAG TPA: TonB family protein [Thermoanaerobaculia bacterium]|jgi:TonB family protein
MPSILVVEQESSYAERIKGALSAEGWKVRVVPGVDQALHAAAAEPPELVMAGTDLPGFEVLLFSFSRAAGGPGVLGVAPADGTGQPDGVDGRLARPFTDQEVVLAARQALLAGRQAVKAAAQEQKLTSQDIFGDVLAEVESNLPPRPAPLPRPAAPVAAAAAVPAAPKPAPPPAQDEEIQRRLEKTLSGVLGTEPRPRPAVAAPSAPVQAPVSAPRRPEPAAGDVDALLSKTLSNLDLGRTRTGVRVPAPAPAPSAPAPPKPAVAAPPAAAQEGTAVRKAKRVGDFDFSELEDLARSGRPSAPPRPAAVPASAPTPAPPAAAAPEPAPAAAPAVAPPPVAADPEPLPFALPPLELEPALAGASVAEDPAATQRLPVFLDESADRPGSRFGQYTLLERIAVGGMAEVWKARMRGVEGFQKTVAIKRILPHMTDNAEFVGMFIDEAKLAAQLTHPNIVHIYDLGKMGRDYYIAMEYVEGKDLRSLLNAGRRKGAPLPLGLGLLIAARVASALDYAHRKRDFEDRELGLVHRDVSPQNVLLTCEGDVKLCDFGIAKAVSKVSQTQMGALKGKLQYMSPEQAWGRPVDARSDLFSLGSVLFEMVTGERLFPGDSEMSVLEAVRQGRTRTPRQVDPALPREVDEIVARAIATDPQNRFQSAGEMKQRLEAALTALAPSIGPTDLAAYIRRVLEPGSAGEPEAAAPPVPAPASRVVEPAAAASAEPFAAGPEAPVEPVAPLVEVAVEEEGGRKGRTLLYAAIAALIVVAVLTFFFLNRRKDVAPAPQSAGPATGAPAAPMPAANPAPDQTAPPAAVPATQAAPATAEMPADIKAIVEKQIAEKEQEERRKHEETLKELEKQLMDSKAKGQPAAAAPAQQTPVEATPASVAPPRPAPETAPPVPAPEPEPQRQPEPAKAEEKPTAPEPAPEPAPARRVKEGDLVEPGPGVAPPQLVSPPKPGYPPMARNLRVEGTVVVSVLVDENGQVEDARLAEPIKQKVGINEAALSAARAARYRPATKDGVRVKMWTRLRIPFKL